MSVERQALSALKWTGLAKLISQIVSWASTLIVLRLLHPEDYGLMAVVTVVVSILATVAEFGIGAAVVQAPSINRSELEKVGGLITLTNLGFFLLAAAG